VLESLQGSQVKREKKRHREPANGRSAATIVTGKVARAALSFEKEIWEAGKRIDKTGSKTGGKENENSEK